MSIKPLNEQLGNDLKEALRSKDKVRLDTIRAILTALKTDRSHQGRMEKSRLSKRSLFFKDSRNKG